MDTIYREPTSEAISNEIEQRRLETERVFDGGWPVGHRFSLSLTVKEKLAVIPFFRIMNGKELLHGCKIESIGTKDREEELREIAVEMKQLFMKYGI